MATAPGNAAAQPTAEGGFCVAQGVVLVICLAPVTGPAAAAALAASALLLLVYSFVVDTWWLARSARPGEG